MTDNTISQPEESAGARLQCPTKPPCRILVVEDDYDLCQVNARTLIYSGYAVDAVEDGAAAWEALQANRYDLVITDNNMPRLTGIELLKKLYATRMVLPVIMATGTLPKEEFTRYPWLQPVAMLLKPYSVEQLLGTVEKVLRATVNPDEAFAPPSNWQGRPIPSGLQL